MQVVRKRQAACRAGAHKGGCCTLGECREVEDGMRRWGTDIDNTQGSHSDVSKQGPRARNLGECKEVMDGIRCRVLVCMGRWCVHKIGNKGNLPHLGRVQRGEGWDAVLGHGEALGQRAHGEGAMAVRGVQHFAGEG